MLSGLLPSGSPASSNEKFMHAVHKEFLMGVVAMIVCLIGYGVFVTVASEGSERRRVFDDKVAYWSRILVALVTIVLVAILFKEYTSDNPDAIKDVKGFVERFGAPGYKRVDGKWVQENWLRSANGENFGAGAFAMGRDAQFVPSKSQVLKAGGGRDLYREKKDAFHEKLAQSRAAKEEQHARVHGGHATRSNTHHPGSHSRSHSRSHPGSHDGHNTPHYAYYYPQV